MDQLYLGAGLAIMAYLLWYIGKELNKKRKK